MRILLSGRALEACGERVREKLGSRGTEFVVSETAGDAPNVDVGFVTRDVIGASTRNEDVPSTARFFSQLVASPGLKWLQVNAAGADRQVYLDLKARGVQVTSAAGANGAVVAQTALAGFLSLSRRFPQLAAAQRQRRWEPLVTTGLPRDLQGQVAVVVGWGSIGRKLGEWLAMLGLQVIVVRHTDTPAEGFETATFASLPRILPRGDWVFAACRLSAETRALFDARTFAAMRKGAHFVNVSRGEVVVEPDLVAALQSGHLGGAYLDVFSHEPLPAESPLWTMPNVLVTPHTAGQSDGIYARVVEIFLDNLARFAAGKPLVNLVN